MTDIAVIALAAWLMIVVMVLLYNRTVLFHLWSEPVLRRPVLIIESDDWGAGPPEQTDALQKLAAILSAHVDGEGRHSVMTLGLVLASVDTRAINATGLNMYQRLGLENACYMPLRKAITEGINKKVFSIQLHGMEHFWPPALMQAARNDRSVRQWLASDEFPRTEKLPAHLQSRWINAAEKPAVPLSAEQINTAVSEEVRFFRDLFDCADMVVVPPTFVWNDEVERAWAINGIKVLVTPGSRYECRDTEGNITPAKKHIFNGQIGDDGLIYIVRNDYFEPSLGHTAQTALAALKIKTGCGRPTLLETHRFNFINDGRKSLAALNELDRLLGSAIRDFPDTAFISTAELARIYRHQDPAWLVDSILARMEAFIRRCRAEYRIWRGFKITGLAVLLSLLIRVLPAGHSQVGNVSYGGS